MEKVPRGPIFLLRRAAQASDNTRSFIETVYRYSREDLIRILQLSSRQLLAWEKAGLLASAESYNFFDLLQVKKVRDLCARHVRPIEIRQSLVAMQEQAAGMENPLLEANASTSGRHRVAFRHEGRLLEPIAGQFMFDFSPGEKVIASVPVTRSSAVPQEPAGADVAELFARGVALEIFLTRSVYVIGIVIIIIGIEVPISSYVRQCANGLGVVAESFAGGVVECAFVAVQSDGGGF
jgi:hypothetical protein